MTTTSDGKVFLYECENCGCDIIGVLDFSDYMFDGEYPDGREVCEVCGSDVPKVARVVSPDDERVIAAQKFIDEQRQDSD